MKTLWLFLVGIGFFMVNPCDLSGQDSKARQAERNFRQVERPSSRMAHRADYWTKDAWPQVTPWIQKYDIRTVRPLSETENRVESAAERTVERANSTTPRSAFGFKEPNASFSEDVWFYDYYNYWPTYFSSTNESAKEYASAVRFYDIDNDGVYETSASYRDSDRDGIFDEFDQYDFSASESETALKDSPVDAKRYTVSGKISSKRTTAVNNSEHVIIRVAQDELTSVVVDLGPAERWAELDVKAGSMIKATGPMERIGEKNVLIAESVAIGEKPVKAEPSSPKYSGTVLEVKKFKVSNVDHTLAIIETSDGNQLVDFGPSDELKADVVAQEKVIVYGLPVRINDRQVVMASRLDIGGKTYSVSRWK